jgi:hypothetical protein
MKRLLLVLATLAFLIFPVHVCAQGCGFTPITGMLVQYCCDSAEQFPNNCGGYNWTYSNPAEACSPYMAHPVESCVDTGWAIRYDTDMMGVCGPNDYAVAIYQQVWAMPFVEGCYGTESNPPQTPKIYSGSNEKENRLFRLLDAFIKENGGPGEADLKDFMEILKEK